MIENLSAPIPGSATAGGNSDVYSGQAQAVTGISEEKIWEQALVVFRGKLLGQGHCLLRCGNFAFCLSRF